jgi:PAS domain S-box-containing protein
VPVTRLEVGVKRRFGLAGALLLAGLIAAAPAAGQPTPPLVYGGDHRFPPYEYIGPGGQPEGYNVELVRELARHAGRDVDIRLGPWRDVLAQFDAGGIDLVSLTYSDARAARYDFLVQTWTLKQGLTFRSGRASYPQALDELAREVVSVEENGSTHDWLRSLPDDRRPVIRPAPDHRAALRMVDRGEATVAAGNALTLRFFASELQIQDLVEVHARANSYHLATQKGGAVELDWIPIAYSRLGTDGTRDRLVEKYLALRPPPRNWRTFAWPLAAIVTLLGGGAAGVVLWNRTLRRQVGQRTAELRGLLQEKDKLARGLEQSQQALREAHENLASLIDCLPLAVVMLDVEGRVRNWNPAAERMFGWTAPEAFGRTLPVVPESQQEEAQGLVDRALRGESFMDVATQRKRKDGALVEVSLSVAPVHGPGGKVTGTIAVLADVGERAQLESQLRQAQKMEAVGRLAGGIAHDFNNLLTAILGYSGLLVRGLGDSGMQRKAEAIGKAAERGAQLTSQLLSFSRQQVLTSRVLDLSSVIARFDSVLRRIIGEDVRLVTQSPPGLWPIRADPGRIEQVLMNLAVNARDAMPQGGTLTLETANVDLDEAFVRLNPGSAVGPHVLLTVKDTGLGMAPEVQKRIFEPFFTTKAAGSGTGLGLATVYGIVKQSAGYISPPETAPGRGTTFRVYLPRAVKAPGEAEWPEETLPHSPEPSASPDDHPTETILLVEDEDVVRDLAREVLEGRGYSVLAARHAGEALLVAERHPGPIHLLLTDVVMPHMGGRELSERVAHLRPGIRLLYVSGYTDDEVLRHGVMEAEVAFLQKPFTAEALLERIRTLLDESTPAPATLRLRESSTGVHATPPDPARDETTPRPNVTSS